MSLIGRLVDKLLTKGRITLLLPGKPPQSFGPGGGKHLTIRLTDRKVAFDIARNPRLRVGEAYMDGRLIVEDGTILDLLELIVASCSRATIRGVPGATSLTITI
jgi:cyclopropane-fatty-acyl-phospholipid synthase